MQALLVTQKRHMVEVPAGAMDDQTAAILGNFNDAELRRVASLMFAHVVPGKGGATGQAGNYAIGSGAGLNGRK